MTLKDADAIASGVIAALAEECKKILVVGSVRRRKKLPKDIEVCVIPKEVELCDLFGAGEKTRAPGFAAAVRRLGVIRMGNPEDGKYVKIDLGTCTLDLFIATPENWGFIATIRTGPAEYSAECMKQLRKAGYWAKDGTVWDPLKGPVTVSSEEEFFSLIGRVMPAPVERVA